ncbi:MAG: DUF2064 domain-containing protein [Rhodanobacteraceae bacterium]
MSVATPLLSVIVPLAPDENQWTGLRDQLAALNADSEIIPVRGVDDGRNDAPAAVATAIADSAAGYREMAVPRGRARQMNAGARAARGSWLWFLHADSRLHPRTLPALRAFVARGDDALGYFDLGFRNDGPWLVRINAAGANFRARHLGLPFGDQGFVLPAAWFARLGRYDEAAAYGEDHLLVWRARVAGLPIRRIGAPLLSSARKYAREGWLRTTTRHLALTARQAWPEWKRWRTTAGDAPTSPVHETETSTAGALPRASALAIFVKTPGYSPIKTRLAAAIGEARASEFHRLSACAVAEVVCAANAAQGPIEPYWAVAEHAAIDAGAWQQFACVWQGDGDLGARLDRIYSTLQSRHGRALLIGADAPQITAELLRAACIALGDPDNLFVLGAARDGGFWLFGGRVPVPDRVWRSVTYSQAHTASELRAALTPIGRIAELPALTDADRVSDLPVLEHALAQLAAPLPGQRALRAWLCEQSLIAEKQEASA